VPAKLTVLGKMEEINKNNQHFNGSARNGKLLRNSSRGQSLTGYSLFMFSNAARYCRYKRPRISKKDS